MIPNFQAGQRLSHADLNAMATEINRLLTTTTQPNPALPRSREQELRTPLRVAGDARLALGNDAPPGFTNETWGKLLTKGRNAHEIGNVDPRRTTTAGVKILEPGQIFQQVSVDEDGHIKSISCIFSGAPEECCDFKWGRWWDGYSTCGTGGCCGGFFTVLLGCIAENTCTVQGCGGAADLGNRVFYARNNEIQVPPITVNARTECGLPLVKPMGSANVVRVRRLAPGAGVTMEMEEDLLRISAGAGSRPINPPGACSCSVPMVGCTTPDGTHIRMLKGYGGTRVKQHPATSPDICQADIISREVCSVPYCCCSDPALDLINCRDCCHVYIRKLKPSAATKGCENGQLIHLWTDFPVTNVTSTHGAAAAPGADGWELTFFIPSVPGLTDNECCTALISYRQLMRFRGSPTEGCLQVVQQERPANSSCTWIPSNIPPNSCS